MHIEGTKSTPSITVEKGVFEIKGRSIPEDAFEFFSPLLHEVQSYMENPSDKTELRSISNISTAVPKNTSPISWPGLMISILRERCRYILAFRL